MRSVDPDALKSDLILMKSMLQKFTGSSNSGKKKELMRSNAAQGCISSGGEESAELSNRSVAVSYVDDKVDGGMKDVVKVDKEVVRQCLSSKCLVEQLPNTLSVSFKGQLFMLSLYLFIH